MESVRIQILEWLFQMYFFCFLVKCSERSVFLMLNKIHIDKNLSITSMNNIFRTTIRDLVSRNKFFQCFVCYEQFDSGTKYPMQVCRNHHYMCDECVKSRAFKSKAKHQYKCGLCSVQIKIAQIKRNPFILSIKDFFQNLIERQELSRVRYKEYMENQEKIVEILLQENQAILNESSKNKEEMEALKLQMKTIQQKQQLKIVSEIKIEKPLRVNKIQPSSEEDEQFRSWSAQKDQLKPPMPANSIFRSNLFKSSLKVNSQGKKQEEFIPNPEFNRIYCQGGKSIMEIKPDSALSRLIQEGKKIKENLIKEEQQSKIRLKESLKELQAHKKYIDLSREDENENLDFEKQEIEGHIGQPQKKVHLDQPQKKPQISQIPPRVKPHNSWFPFA